MCAKFVPLEWMILERRNTRCCSRCKLQRSSRRDGTHIIHSYGGPNSQQVNLKYNVDWHYFLAAYHKYVVVVVDGRGTGFKGRSLRNPVKDNLGHWETVDQINAAK